MTKKNILVVIFILVLLFLNFFSKAYLRQKEAMEVVLAVLASWETNDIPKALSFWENMNSSPPISNLLSYEIGEKTFGKKGDQHTALVTVTLYFPENNQFPSGREWVFELNKTRHGWKITDFRLLVKRAPR